jgi:hypothetical protein
VQDLYVTLSRDKEPGKDSYDFKSAEWDETDEVVISPSNQPYCTDW